MRNTFILFILCILTITTHSYADSEVILVGIAGGSGSGKTTLAESLAHELQSDCITITQDSYYKDLSHLTMEERAQTNFDHPDSIDTALFSRHINMLKNNKAIDKPTYDFLTHSRIDETTHVAPKKIILIEGILVLAMAEVRDLLDFKIFVDVPDDIRLLRRIERDMTERGRSLESISQQYIKTVRPMYLKFVDPSKWYADIIVPHGGKNNVALSFLSSKLKTHS
jgi:uridine kinase